MRATREGQEGSASALLGLWLSLSHLSNVEGSANGARGNEGVKRKARTHQALSLFPIDWSLGVGGHWRAKVRGWLHEKRVTERCEGPGEVRPGVRLRHDRKWGGRAEWWSAGGGEK